MKVAYARVRSEALVSRKGDSSNAISEVSGTTNICTDEQELYRRHNNVDEQAHHCEVRRIPSALLCRCSSHRWKAIYLTGGDPTRVVMQERKSAEVIVPVVNEPSPLWDTDGSLTTGKD